MTRLRHLATVGLIAFGSIWGTLARMGLKALNTYDGQSIEPVIWAQAFACLVMGWAYQKRNHKAIQAWYAPISTMLVTGFCGSCTTYSVWMFRVFQGFSNELHFQRHGLHNVMDALTQTGATIGLGLVSYWGGTQVAHLIPAYRLIGYVRRQKEEHEDKEKPPPKAEIPPSADIACIALGVVFWAASAILCGTYAPFRKETFALVLSPPGAILRWYLARFNGPLDPYERLRVIDVRRWPNGTLLANTIAIFCYCAAETAQHVGYVTGPGARGIHSLTGCQALYGFQEGFCDTLSTLSTLVMELVVLRPPRVAFAYLFVSWLIGILVSILIVGIPWWTLGMQGSCA